MDVFDKVIKNGLTPEARIGFTIRKMIEEADENGE